LERIPPRHLARYSTYMKTKGNFGCLNLRSLMS
jgi:hypothetical protein